MGASATARCPFGFVCGFPVQKANSELYGYVKGTGKTERGEQSAAVVKAIAQWGSVCERGERQTELDFPVCKRGYAPFDSNGQRAYGCAKHGPVRRKRMLSVASGEEYARPGWESFHQWDDAPPPARGGRR